MEFTKSFNKYVAYSKDEGDAVMVSLYYEKGGVNYYSYNNCKRGIYLSVNKVKISREQGYQTVKSIPTDGARLCILELKRRSEKQLTAQAKRLNSKLTDIVNGYLTGKTRETLLPLIVM